MKHGIVRTFLVFRSSWQVYVHIRYQKVVTEANTFSAGHRGKKKYLT